MKSIVNYILEKNSDVCPKCGKKNCECSNDDVCPKCGKSKEECTCKEEGEE